MATCPHNCRRCRAIELGFAGRPLTQEEWIEVQGGVIVPEPEPNGWAPDTAEAALAVDVAQFAFEEVQREWLDAYREYESAGPKDRSRLGAAVAAARIEVDEAGERLLAARVTHQRLVERDQHAHRLERGALMAAEVERQRKEEQRARLKAGRSTLRALAKKAGQ